MDVVPVTTADGITHDRWLESIMATSLPSSTVRIHKVPTTVKDYEKYYVPKVVSIGPYHYRNNSKLELVENLKPLFMKKLVSNNKETLQNLLCKLGGMVKEFRDFYEDKSTDAISDEDFSRMMMLDGCFILYYIKTFCSSVCDEEYFLGMKSHQIACVHEDLFLLENQIPFLVIKEVMKEVKDQNWYSQIYLFINNNVFGFQSLKSGWHSFKSACQILFCTTNSNYEADPSIDRILGGDHLLQLLQHRLTGSTKELVHYMAPVQNNWYPFRTVMELSDVGIHFKWSKIMSLAHINFERGWFSANLKLPPIIVDDSTKPMFLNLVAYEMFSNDDSWVTSYICLLHSLIDHPEDVKVLRKAGVIDNCLGRDSEVVQLFNEISTDLVPKSHAYMEARHAIQMLNFDSKRRKLLWQLKQEYIKSPWSFIALVGGILALFLTAVQAYFSVWSRPSECDGLCAALKKNHHL